MRELLSRHGGTVMRGFLIITAAAAMMRHSLRVVRILLTPTTSVVYVFLQNVRR